MSSQDVSPGGFNSVLDILQTLQRGWRIIAGVTVACGLAGTAYALLAQETFKAEAVLVSAERNRVSDTLGQFSGLASLAGVNLRSGSDPTPLAVLKSKEFAIDFVSDPEVNRAIVAAMPSWDKPVDIRRVATYFDLKVREVQEDKRAGVVTVSIRWTDPATAAKWANLVVQRLNDKLRDRALAESEQNVEYLQKQIAGASLLPLQQSLGRVLEFEMQKLMLARGNDEFAFKIVDRAVPPIERFSPQRLLVILLSFLAGLSLSALLVLTLPRFRYDAVQP